MTASATASRNIGLFKVFMSPDVARSLQATLHSGWIGEGPRVKEFERALRSCLGVTNLATVNSATSGLTLIMHTLRHGGASSHESGLNDGDEVITTPLTCVATNWAVLANHLKIRWVDVDADDLNVSMTDLKRKIGPRTKCIVVVHWGGYAADLAELRSVIDAMGDGIRPAVIEDCAHALGGAYQGRPIGSHGNNCVFSFQAVKPLTTGDGGAVIIPDDEMFERARRLRWYGLDRTHGAARHITEQDIPEWGFKMHMNDVSASVGLANLPHLSWILDRQRENAKVLREALQSIDGIRPLRYKADRVSSDYLFTVVVEQRQRFEAWLGSCGIEARLPHRRNDEYSCVREYREELPILDSVYDTITCIPCGWWLSDEELQYIVSCIGRGW